MLDQLRSQLAAWNEDPPGFDWSWRTVGEYLDRLDADGIAINAAYLAPHGTIRMCAMGTEDRAPTPDELAHMKTLLADALEQGAVGLSTGLTYTPGMYADDDEIVALLEVVREHGGYYTPHHRNYGRRALDAYADCIEIARRSGVPLHLAHAHLGWLFIHSERGAKCRYAPDLLKDPIVSFVDRTFVVWALSGFAVAFGLGWAIGGTWPAALTGLLWGGGVRMLVVHHVTYSINSLCHFFGRKDFDTGDKAIGDVYLKLSEKLGPSEFLGYEGEGHEGEGSTFEPEEDPEAQS